MKVIGQDYWKMIDRIEVGYGIIEFEKEGETLCIEYEADEDGYVEDDYHCGYMNGTGGYVVTSRDLNIISVESYNVDGDETDNDFDEEKL